ncbi:AAA family ATPase [Clostridium thermarum]|uniref:AAA family ATPase n=1 Tax=Clostridium thermarum TaxID=1716543 RepID=UPI0013D580DB|nr:AAA family ATPase [Clostridium thermarum]
MSFGDAYNIVKKILNNIGVYLQDEQNYDGIAVKKLESSNTLDEGRTTNQTHIAITSSQMDIFPYLRAEGYFSTDFHDRDEDLKKYFSLRIPVQIDKNNYEYLKNSNVDKNININFGDKSKLNVYSHVVRSRRFEAADQVQLSFISFDHDDFINFRKLIHRGDFLIILKEKQKFSYEFYGVRGSDINYNGISLQSLNNKFEKINTNTFVSASEIYLEDENKNDKKHHSDFKGENIIYYGAPGTGKSHTLEEISRDFDYVERVTFYPEYTHDDFIGSFMPSMTFDKKQLGEYVSLDETEMKLPGKPMPYYTYIPGPFTLALVQALNNPDKSVLLIVEELNRANAPAVFGEFFQLLDRKNNGESKYSISVSNEYSEYLSSQVETYSKGDKVTIPANFTICATMNSADQGVNPLDSAFKRRWNFIYVPIDFSKAKHRDYEIEYTNKKVTWEVFATTINEQLKRREINEDKHLGQYFITETEITNSYKFASKILLYLFDDVLKFNRRGFFKSEYKTFSDLLNAFIYGKEIFEFEFAYVPQGSGVKHDNTDGSEVAMDTEVSGKVSELNEIKYSEQLENEDMTKVAEE